MTPATPRAAVSRHRRLSAREERQIIPSGNGAVAGPVALASSAPVELLERVLAAADEIPRLLDEMLHGSHVTEVMNARRPATALRSTRSSTPSTAVSGDVSGALGRHAGLTLPELTGHLYVHYAGAAVQHLFAVAAWIPYSMVIGAGADPRPAPGGVHRRRQHRRPARSGARCTSCRAAGAARRQGRACWTERRRGRLGRVRGSLPLRPRRSKSPGDISYRCAA